MEKKIPYHLKGKGIERGYSPPPRRRIKAPDLDTSDLIAANSLTLMGRLTNPVDQRLWSLFPFLSSRWTLKGKAIGSDLGRGCFQFCFDYEEDLQKVLDNRPYHFDQWMVILQKWEPTISDTFPSMIPFWIELQGLPKHFWQPEILTTIGEELGEIMDMEITPAAAKIRILINGLQPLVKETVVDFPDGSEALVSLEYKNLKNHCHHCLRLSHEKKNCPGLREEKEAPSAVNPTALSQGSRGLSRNYYTPSDNFTAHRHLQGDSRKPEYPQQSRHDLKRNYEDRERRSVSHSKERSFSRNHHPPRSFHGRSADHQERRSSRDRNYLPRKASNRANYHQNLQWREKSPCAMGSRLETSDSSRTRRPPLERNISNPDPLTPPPPPFNGSNRWRQSHIETVVSPLTIPTKEQVMGELREVTVQYTTCADPTESAARKQRVLQGEARNLMSTTADQIIEAAAASAPSLTIQELDGTSTAIPPRISLSGDLPTLPQEKEKIVKRGRGRPPLATSSNKLNLKLTGAKSQKRNLMQNSPKKNPSTKASQKSGQAATGPSKPSSTSGNSSQLSGGQATKTGKTKTTKTSAPKINLIPAVKRAEVDFLNPPAPLP